MTELASGAFADLLAGYCLDVQAGQETVLVRSTSLAAPLLLELQRAILERDAWPLLRVELPGADAVPTTRTRASATSTTTPTWRSPRPSGSTRCWASRRPATSASWQASTPTASRATPARGARSARRR